jgi:preprotein translocase subunit SecA
MGQIYHALGLKASCIVHDAAFIYDPAYQQADSASDLERDEQGGFKVLESYLRPVPRKEAYEADITYGTNNEFGFDYLKDNMSYDLGQMSQRDFNFAIVDEVDSILIDEARTPLIISAPDTASSKFYQEFAKIIPQLDSKTDYQIDEKTKTVTLTEEGINRVEKIMGVSNIYEERGMKFLRYLEQSLKAQVMFKRDKDYVVKDGQIIIVDEFTGRLMPGRRWSGGLHQAVEAKEGVLVNPESLTLASITFQNYFRMYKKLAGMTGTAATSAEEFDKVYHLEVAIVPTNNPLKRQDLSDRIYKSAEGKFKAVVEEIKQRHKEGQPVLVGTTSIEKNEYLGKLLDREGVAHQILNAKQHEKEGQIIAQAGKFGQVTIATNMAGRGVDIILGGNPADPAEAEKVKQVGGLHIIGTERHEARRIDNQLRGRAGRQGDPGSSQFFLSLEDDLMRIFASDKIKSLMTALKIPEDQPIEARLVSGAIGSAQEKIEGMNFDLRKHILEYDDVMNKHREVFYRRRKDVLEKANKEGLKKDILEMVKRQGGKEEDYEKKEKELGSDKMRQIEKIVFLRVLDMLWLEHLENMDYLRDSVRLRAYGQRDPLVEYKSEGHKMFQELLKRIEIGVANTILRVSLNEPPKTENTAAVSAKKDKVGRNDPCPCGSGKKYKKCGLLNTAEHQKNLQK